MATVSVRYIVDDVDAAIAFYCAHLGFSEQMHPAPSFAMLTRGDLRLVLSAPGGGPGGGQAMPDGTLPEPGGWNRFSIEVDDLDGTVARAARGRRAVPQRHRRRGWAASRSSSRTRPETRSSCSNPPGPRLGSMTRRRLPAETYQVRPIGWVESTLVDPADAPNQGHQGAPDAWLVINPEVREGIRDLQVGSDILVLTWLHQARRDELATRPGDDPTGPERGVFSTRSPARPNPVGLHRATDRRDRGRQAPGPPARSDQRDPADRHQARPPSDGP